MSNMTLVFVHVPEVCKIKIDAPDQVEEEAAVECQEEYHRWKPGKRMRQFIKLNQLNGLLSFVAESSYSLSGIKWVEFKFVVKTSDGEEVLRRLREVGIGIQDGVGIVSAAPLQFHRKFQMQVEPNSQEFIRRTSTAGGIAVPPVPGTASTLTSFSGTLQPAASLDVSKYLKSEQASPAEESGKEDGLVKKPASVSFQPDKSLSSALSSGATTQDWDPEDDGLALTVEPDREPKDQDTDIQASSEEKKNLFLTNREFIQSVKARVAVDTVLDLINAASQISFDYVALIAVASMLACVGLLVNSTVVIVASMLVSPLMGPILAITFGCTVWERAMINRGLVGESIGLVICVIVGFFGGLFGVLAIPHENLPTTEMWSRAEVNALWIGAAVAIPSGFGVALSILGNNTSSLVGVAISASLLPPAVNTGILLAMGALHYTDFYSLDKSGTVVNLTASQVLTGAAISLGLTLLNIICIIGAGWLMFKLKEVAPIDKENEFWHTFVPQARIYNTIKGQNSETEMLKQHALRIKKGDVTGKTDEEVMRNLAKHASLSSSLDQYFSSTVDHRHERKSSHVALGPNIFTDPLEEQEQQQAYSPKRRNVRATQKSKKHANKSVASVLEIFSSTPGKRRAAKSDHSDTSTNNGESGADMV